MSFLTRLITSARKILLQTVEIIATMFTFIIIIIIIRFKKMNSFKNLFTIPALFST